MSEELRPVNVEIDITVDEVVKYQEESTSTFKCSLVAGLFNQNYPVPKTSGNLSSHCPSQFVKVTHSTCSKMKLDHENCFNKGNKIFDLILTEKESPQAYGLPIL